MRLPTILACLCWLIACQGKHDSPGRPTALITKSMMNVDSINAQPWPIKESTRRIWVKKSSGEMKIYTHAGRLIRQYRVAIGRNPLGHKQQEGDRRTPEGIYHIDGKNPHSQYFKNLGISYPNAQDRAAAKALGKPPGGDVKIHGLAKQYAWVGKRQSERNWTYGCIALNNEEMEELYQHTAVGTVVEIVP